MRHSSELTSPLSVHQTKQQRTDTYKVKSSLVSAEVGPSRFGSGLHETTLFCTHQYFAAFSQGVRIWGFSREMG